MFSITVSPDFLAYLLAGLAAILFDWFPGLSAWFDQLSEVKKKQVMAVLLLCIVLVIYVGSCAGIFASGYACDRIGFAALAQVLFVSVGINQGAHLLLKPSAKG